MADPQVAVAGCIGATEVASVAWWEAAVTAGRVIHRYPEYGGGELDAFAWARTAAPPAEVDMVAGFLLVLSPWAVRSLRFDEELFLGTGFDLDFCLRARDAGKKVVTADLQVIHHRQLEVIGERDAWVEAHIQLAEKWHGRLPGAPRARRTGSSAHGGRGRARRSPDTGVLDLLAPRSAARSARARASAMTTTLGWRLTAPLRQLNALRRRPR